MQVDVRNNFITIQGWMLDYHLRPNELLAFALVYGFSQDRESKFHGSISYIQTWLNCSRPTAIETMKSLEEKGLVAKEQSSINKVIINYYSSLVGGSKEILPPVKNLNQGSKEIALGVVRNFNHYNNNDNNININNPLYANASPKGDEVKRSRVDYKLEEYPIEWHVALQEWIDYKKKERKDKLTPIGLRRFYNLANETCEGNIEWVRYSIQHTANHGWMGFQPLSKKEYDDKRTSGAIPETSVPADRDNFAF